MVGGNLHSSLYSLAQGCHILGIGEVLGSHDGTLAPGHDGFCPDFAAAAEVRATFDEAEPMVTHWHVDAIRAKSIPDITVRPRAIITSRFLPSHWIVSVIFDVCTITCREPERG